ncbi:MAG: D-2-hydroxyacid dehydrogenase [Hyphomonas sp.]|uniref:D-2-hydroxyacid dehydrogenase n=1 Tax=Hyphomonas sp. TaxID=87 RepID=UPI00352734FC
MTDEGQFYHAGSRVVSHAPNPHIAFGNPDAWFGGAARDFMKAVLTSNRLDWFQSAAAGLDNAALISIGKAAKHYTTNHTQAESMAEWALWQALDFLREGPAHRAQQDAAEWKRLRAREIAGSRWLIVGYGSIGQAVGTRVTALGGHVTGLRRSPGPAEGAHEIYPMGLVPDELPKADIVLLCVPHTPETEGIAGATFFSRMKPDALFMNLGRGALVDEEALVAALDAGHPAAAALDVTATEPLPPESPLWHHPKIRLTPHDSPETTGTILRADGTFVENLHRYVKGEPLLNLVDPRVFEDAG